MTYYRLTLDDVRSAGDGGRVRNGGLFRDTQGVVHWLSQTQISRMRAVGEPALGVGQVYEDTAAPAPAAA